MKLLRQTISKHEIIATDFFYPDQDRNKKVNLNLYAPIKNVCLINIRNGVDFPNTRTLLYNICYNLIQDAEIENFRPHKKRTIS